MVIALLVLAGSVYAGDVDTLVSKRAVYLDTLTATKDTVDVGFRNDEKELNHFYITSFATTGADTIQVFTLSPDGLNWVQVGLTDLASGSVVTQIITSTTKKSFIPLDPFPIKMRFICTDAGSASSVLIYGGQTIP